MDTPAMEIEKTLQQALRSFRILGAASQDKIIKRLDAHVNDAALEAIKEEYYGRGGLAGRMLLRAWGQSNPSLGAKFTEWLCDDPVPQIGASTTGRGACALWRAPSRPLSSAQTFIQLSPAHLALLEKIAVPKPPACYTPFGPEKAEDDPRLCSPTAPSEGETIPSLFYDKMPWYAEISAEQHGLFFAPRGCGRTAAIWRARHAHRITGYQPALSLYLLLRPPFEPAHLLNLVADALGRALLCALAEDAYWFIAAERETQADMGRFLLGWAGDFAVLLQRLRDGGLPITADPIRNTGDKSDTFYDSRLLTDVLGRYSPWDHLHWDDMIAVARAARVAIGKAYPVSYQEDWNYPIYLWVDFRLPQATAYRELPPLWEHDSLRQMGNLKIFTQHEFPEQGQIRMEWEPRHLHAMLQHRWDCVKADLFLDQEHLGETSYRSLQDFLTNIPDTAHSPQEVIREGNRLLEAWGEPLIAGR